MRRIIVVTILFSSLLLLGCASEDVTSRQVYGLQDVAAHASSTWCRSIVRNNVYDLTTWISQHPGGSWKILSICGKDATPIFEKVHGWKEKPETQLEKFIIGTLK
jgi:cytochrome b involved in lipid metabolism